jgi:hypothetical protein
VRRTAQQAVILHVDSRQLTAAGSTPSPHPAAGSPPQAAGNSATVWDDLRLVPYRRQWADPIAAGMQEMPRLGRVAV